MQKIIKCAIRRDWASIRMGIQDNKTMNEAITSSTMASKTGGGTPLSATPLSGRRSKMSLVHSQSAASVQDDILFF